MQFQLKNRRVFVAGHRGLVGSALMRRLTREECTLLTVPRAELDLRDAAAVDRWIAAAKPDGIILAAARVGGIGANRDYPADFLLDNLLIATSVIQAAHRHGVAKLLYLGSSCIYPRDAAQPISPAALLTGALEPTNEAYAIAKIAGLKLCEAYRRQHGCDFISAMPCNLYGPDDTYDAQGSHVIPALIMKMVTATDSVTVWGTGKPLREFLHVDDLADALVFLLEHYSDAAPVNVGSGTEISIADLAREIAGVVGYCGRIAFDPAHPDGTPRKVMDSSVLRAMGWMPRVALRDGLRGAYADFVGRQSLVP